MKLLIVSKDKGFSLIEIIIVSALVLAVFSFSFYFSFNDFYNYNFREDRDLLIMLLQHARAESMSNLCRGKDCLKEKLHGVAIRPVDYPNSYVLFQTTLKNDANYTDRSNEDKKFDMIFESNKNTLIDKTSLSEIIFESLSGEVKKSGIIILSDKNSKTSTIEINNHGQIRWTN